VFLRYGPSDGYVAYDYSYNKGGRTLTIRVSGTGDRFRFHLLLPSGTAPTGVTVDGAKVAHVPVSVDKSRYVDFEVARPCGGTVVIALGAPAR
jgi:hypothetical protein